MDVNDWMLILDVDNGFVISFPAEIAMGAGDHHAKQLATNTSNKRDDQSDQWRLTMIPNHEL